jgi:hypothetical protein
VNAMQGRVPGHPDIRQSRPPDTRFSNTAELSGELSVGDVAVIGEVALAVGRPVGWEPVSGPLTEVRTREHGTRPLDDRFLPESKERPDDNTQAEPRDTR